MTEVAMTLEGQLIGASGKTDLAGVKVWFAYRSANGHETTDTAMTDEAGRFLFPVPTFPLDRAWIGANLEGVSPLDLEPGGATLDPGDVVLIVDDIVPSHLRYGGG